MKPHKLLPLALLLHKTNLIFFPPAYIVPGDGNPPPLPQPLSQAVPLYKLRSYVCRIGRALVGGEEK